MAWDNISITYRLKSVRLTAAIRDGGAVIERRNLDFIEGRSARGMVDGRDQEVSVLEWVSYFGVPDAPEPLSSEFVEARIVIEGTHEDGAIEVRGDGWFGYDNRGNPEGYFEKPPRVLLGQALEYPPSEGDEISPDELAKQMKANNPKMSSQMLKAMRWRSMEEES